MWEWLIINWGSTASAVGLLVSVGGFSFAIRQIVKTRGSVEAAEKATMETRDVLARNLTIDDLTRASLRLQQVKDLHLANEWHRALDRYHDISTTLADIRSRHPSLGDEDKTKIQEAVTQLAELDRAVRDSIRAGSEPDDLSRRDSALTTAQTLLNDLASDLRQAS